MNKIKVLHVANMVGGVEICIRQIINNVDNNKIDSLIASQSLKEKEEFLNKDKMPIKSFRITIVRNISLLRDLICLLQLAKIIYSEKPDIIHAHSAKAGFLCRILSKLTKTQVLYTPHAFSFLSAKNKFLRNLFLMIERLSISKNTTLVATSESEQNLAIEMVGYKKNKTIILNNSIDIKTTPNSKSKFTNNLDNYICTVARPCFQKNLEMMINAFKIVSEKDNNIHLFIIGAGEYSPQKKALQSQIDKMCLKDRITILPWISRDEVQKILFRSKIYLSTSLYEGLPYSVLESMRYKIPSVLTNTFGNKDLLINNKTGFLVDLNDELDMSEKILILMNDKAKRKIFGENAYNLLNDKYNFQDYISKLTNLYITKFKH